MNLSNHSSSLPTSSTPTISIALPSLATRYLFGLTHEPLTKPTSTSSSTSTACAISCTADAGGSFDSGETYESYYSHVEDSEEEQTYSNHVTFQYDGPAPLGDSSENWESSIEVSTSIPEETTTTCGGQAGATCLEGADTTLGKAPGEEESQVTRATARPAPTFTAKPRARPKSTQKPMTMRRVKTEDESEVEESAVFEIPAYKKSAAALWVLLLWFGFA